ncbi:MAG: rod shape-determining protein MreD [Bacteroidaceae bacterium]|nr:rod shape-determining protein MreD [Bacteroidaceae bacterium]
MIQTQLRNLAWLFLLAALQAFIFGHIHLLGYATPMVFVLFAARLHRGTSRTSALLWCFAMGLVVDMFALTPGLAAASMTLVGLLQPPLFERMLPRDAVEDCSPSFSSLGVWRYIEYLAFLVIVHNVVFFALEACTLAHWHDSLLRMAASSLLSIIIILPIEKIRE